MSESTFPGLSDPASSPAGRAVVPVRLTEWVRGRREGQNPEAIRLFCFPYAGGGASAFANWPASFPEQIMICPIQYPGREDRWGEPLPASIESFVERLADDLESFLSAPYAFFGHSFGSLIAFELARELARRNRPGPVRLFLSGARAPHLPLREAIHELPEAEFIDKLCGFDGMPAEVRQNADLLSVVLPVIREDFRLFERYRFQPGPPLSIPVSVFAGLSDASVPLADVMAWSAHTCKVFRSRFLEGDHFFLWGALSQMAHYIAEDLRVSAGAHLPERPEVNVA